MGVYEKLGVTPIINASGAVTRLGGAPMSQAVLEAYREAAGQSVPLEQLQAAASRVIARITGAEAGLVTAGAAAALTLGAAAVLAGYDVARMARLPDCEGLPHEFVVAREHRNGYDHAVRASGARLVEVGLDDLRSGAGVRRVEAWEYEVAFSPRTAGVLYVLTEGALPPLAEVVRRAHAHALPVLVDAAGELPPRDNLRSVLLTGADLVCFSGGKAIGGPQATGILCGRRELVASAALQMLDMDDHFELWDPPADWIDRSKLLGMPRQGIGRAFKVSKEQIAALLVALEAFAAGDGNARVTQCLRLLDTIAGALNSVCARCRIVEGHDECLPILEIAIDEQALGRNAFEVCKALRAGTPPCYVGHAALGEGKLLVNPMHLDDKSAGALASRLERELTPKR